MITVVPIENIQATVGSGFLGDGHEPGVVGLEKVGVALAAVGRAATFKASTLTPLPWMLPMKRFAIFGRISVAVKQVDSAVGRFLMVMFDD